MKNNEGVYDLEQSTRTAKNKRFQQQKTNLQNGGSKNGSRKSLKISLNKIATVEKLDRMKKEEKLKRKIQE
ncbi:hypothetical protein CEXT_709081, partial [Caerostris extrusa]